MSEIQKYVILITVAFLIYVVFKTIYRANYINKQFPKFNLEDEEEVKAALREIMQAIFDEVDNSLKLETKPSVILVVGVNGVGKTTSIGKIANRLAKDGKKVVIAAADTFRAAAVEQLEIKKIVYLQKIIEIQ